MNALAALSPEMAHAEARTMKAVVQRKYGNVDQLQLAEIARPQIAPNEVLVQVRAAGLDRGTWHLMTGRPYLMRLMGFGFFAPKNPVPGLDVAGTVAEVGAAVTRFKVGDEVFGIAQGSFAQYARALEDKLARKPAGTSFEQSAVLGVSGLTALQAVRAAKVKPGQRVLIIGASGGVGSFAVQLAKGAGAEVTGVCSASKADLVRSLGADQVVDYQTVDFTAAGSRYHAILDLGGNTRLSRLRRVLTTTGVLVFVGGENGGDWTAGFGRMLLALAVSLLVKQRFVMLMNKEHFSGLEELTKLVEAKQLTPSVDRVCSLGEVPSAMRSLEAGQVRGKVAITLV